MGNKMTNNFNTLKTKNVLKYRVWQGKLCMSLIKGNPLCKYFDALYSAFLGRREKAQNNTNRHNITQQFLWHWPQIQPLNFYTILKTNLSVTTNYFVYCLLWVLCIDFALYCVFHILCVPSTLCTVFSVYCVLCLPSTLCTMYCVYC